MYNFQVGDLIAQKHPKWKKPLRVGVVLSEERNQFSIKWTWYNKSFYMEKEEDIFKELNNSYLLNTEQVLKDDRRLCLLLLNSNYSNGKVNENRESHKKDCQTDSWKAI